MAIGRRYCCTHKSRALFFNEVEHAAGRLQQLIPLPSPDTQASGQTHASGCSDIGWHCWELLWTWVVVSLRHYTFVASSKEVPARVSRHK